MLQSKLRILERIPIIEDLLIKYNNIHNFESYNFHIEHHNSFIGEYEELSNTKLTEPKFHNKYYLLQDYSNRYTHEE